MAPSMLASPWGRLAIERSTWKADESDRGPAHVVSDIFG